MRSVRRLPPAATPATESFFFLADYHALVKCDDPARIQRSTLEIAASWLACGLDPEKVYFYRQSDIPEIPELTWLLTCVTAKGLLNRAHAYKAATDDNRGKGDDPDAGVNAGLYMYPVLMAADILLFHANQVPVGRDQIQHIEMARDIGQRFNHLYGSDYFTLPEAAIEDNVATLPGLDGRKMSKSYDNTIPLWLPQKDLRKAILGIVTNSQMPGEPKNPDESHIFSIYQAFASADETAAMRKAYADGIGWGDAKQKLFERIDARIGATARTLRGVDRGTPERIEDALLAGAERARALSRPFIERLRHAVGLRSLRSGSSGSRNEKRACGKAGAAARSVPRGRRFRLQGARCEARRARDARRFRRSKGSDGRGACGNGIAELRRLARAVPFSPRRGGAQCRLSWPSMGFEALGSCPSDEGRAIYRRRYKTGPSPLSRRERGSACYRGR